MLVVKMVNTNFKNKKKDGEHKPENDHIMQTNVWPYFSTEENQALMSLL
jgi:hypothetical protein